MGFLPFLSKNLDFSNISLGGCAGMGEEILTIFACLSLEEPNFNNFVGFWILGVNLFIILLLK